MATKSKKTAAKEADAKVVRITASGGKKSTPKAATTQAEQAKAPAKTVTKKPTAAKTKASTTPKSVAAPAGDKAAKKKNIFAAIGGYFAGAWYELKQVQWPNRRATWSLTGAMLAYTAFFVVVILLLDTLFNRLFEGMLG